MTRATILLAALLLLLSGGYLAVDRQLTDLLRSELENAALSELLEFRELHVEPFDHAVVRDATLRDPLSGQAVAHVDELYIDIVLDIDWEGETHFDVDGLRGRGGQALLSVDGDELVLARAINELITRINALLPPTDPDGPPVDTPPMTFEDIDVLVHADGQAIDRFHGVTARILDVGNETLLQVQTEQGGQAARRAGRRSTLVAAGALQEGEAQLLFDRSGRVLRVESRGFRVGPALVQLEPTEGERLARELRPAGKLDMVAVRGEGDDVVVTGTLRDGQLSIPLLGFDLYPRSVPFRVVDGVGTVDRAEMGFAGGTALVSLDDRDEELVLELEVREADFREEFLELIPLYSEFGAIDCEDGGRFELELVVVFREDVTQPEIEGRGGFHIHDVRVETPVGPLRLQDVVGSFESDEDQLAFPEVSARVASGVVRGHGKIASVSDLFELGLRVEDIDLADLVDQLGFLDRTGAEVAGWVEGTLQLSGTPDIAGTLGGEATWSVRAGDLWDTPLFEQMLLALPLSDKDARGRQSMQGRVTLLPDRVEVDAVRISSDVITLEGAGSVGWDGRLDMQFVPAIPLGSVGRVLQWLQRELLVNLKVEGRLLAPRVVALPFNLVTGQLRDGVRRLLPDPEAAGSEGL